MLLCYYKNFKIYKQHLFSFAAVEKIKCKIINHSSNPLPSYATHGSSGMDIRAHLDAPLILAADAKSRSANRFIH